MTKLRVHELAKELNKSNKELLDVLKEKNIEVKSHMSSLADDQVEMVKKTFSGGKPEEAAEPKKKTIVQVFHPQNAQNGARAGAKPVQKPATGQVTQSSTGQGTPRPVNTQGTPHPANTQGTPRPANTQGTPRPANTQGTPRPANTQGQRPTSNYQGQRPSSNYQGQRPNSNYQGQRPNSNYQGQRPAGSTEQRPSSNYQGQRPSSNYQGQRPSSNYQGQRPNSNYQGQRPAGSTEQRPSSNYQGQRPNNNYQGQRPNNNYQGQRPAGGPGQRPSNNYQGQRPNNGPGGRRDDNRNGAPSVPSPVLTENQKQQRQKAKDNYKKKDHHEVDRDDKELKQSKKMKNFVPLKTQPKVVEKVEEKVKMITIPEVLTIKELAEKMKMQPSVIVKKLFLQGKVVTVNQEIDFKSAEEIAIEFDCLVEAEEVIDVIEELLKEDEEDESKMSKRPPVVCVMGHVDHGKTSLLDAIRNTNVIDREAGGITQHIGASVINVKGEKITFLDTPGHEAFTAMRMRGANSTDIAILVVAADDGVMPQTIEAINHAKAAGIEIIVAINKMDKPSANIERVKQELTEYELIPEDWGGSTVFVPVSAKTHEGIEDLLEMVVLTAEVLELKANPLRRARGLVIEAELDKGKGSVATVLVQKGTLRVGDSIAAGAAYGKVRAMMDDKGRRVKEAGPSMAVEILGLNDVPNAGEVFVECENDKEARSFAATFISQNRVKLLDDTKAKLSLDGLFDQIKAGNVKELGIVVKADVQGSVEALKQSLLKLSNEEVIIKIIHGGVGAINESDVSLASASNAIIIGFNVRPDATAKGIAEREGVDLRLYRVIYNAIEDVEAAMKGMLDPIFEEKVLGHAEVRQTFKASGVGTIAGSYVLDGIFQRDCSVRVTRDGKLVFEGALASLKRFKDDVKEVKTGFECGLVFEKFNDIAEGDQVEAYKMVEIPR
ncbi:MAG: translation initiation factor IF-2 [Lachnospiraceae bacterium]